MVTANSLTVLVQSISFSRARFARHPLGYVASVAQKVTLEGGTEVKIRRPWGVFLLTIVTLWIYYLVWYYKINREMRDQGIDVSPGVALLAITLGGFLIVPPFVSTWRTFKRIKTLQENARLDEPHVNHVTGFVLYLIALILLPFETAYAQHHLNRVWRHEISEAEKRGYGMRPQVTAG
jgi:hypothetical protein